MNRLVRMKGPMTEPYLIIKYKPGKDGLMCKDKYPSVCHHISKKQCKENDSIKQACQQSCNLCDKDIGIQCKFSSFK